MNDSLNNKELVAVGHQFAKAMSSDTPIIDMAKIVSRLAERLDCTTAALREMTKQRDALAAENGQMLRLLTDISENHDEYVNQDEHLYAGVPMDYVSEINAYVSRDVEAENPFNETDAYLAEVRARAITGALEESSEHLDTDCVMDRFGISYEDAGLRSAGAIELHDALVSVANQVRQRGTSAVRRGAGQGEPARDVCGKGGSIMAKTAAERKAAQRARQAAAGKRTVELHLDLQEAEMLEVNCAARRPGRDPYEMGEYIAMLIRQDNARLSGRIKAISTRQCGKCGDRLPVKSCPCAGDSACWVTLGWHETKLTM